MRLILLLALFIVPTSALAQVKEKFRTFGEWHITPPDTNAMTDAITHKAFTELQTEIEERFRLYENVLTLDLSCNPDTESGFLGVVVLPGVTTPTKARFRIDKNPVHERIKWIGMSQPGFAVLAIPEDQLEAFVREGRGGSTLLIEVNGDIFTYSLVGFDEAIDALRCGAPRP